MLQPKKMKHRKWQKGRIGRVATRGTELDFGSFGLKSMTPGWVKASQIEAARRTVTRGLKRKGRLWIRIFPHKPVTSKGTEFPMGGGKGSVSHYVFPIEPGRIIFELDGVKEDLAREVFRKAASKFSVATKFVKRSV